MIPRFMQAEYALLDNPLILYAFAGFMFIVVLFVAVYSVIYRDAFRR